MDKTTVIETIQNILSEAFGFSKDEIGSDLEKSLFLSPYRMDAISMTYLFLLLQEKFQVKIASESIGDYQFSSMESIATLIMNSR